MQLDLARPHLLSLPPSLVARKLGSQLSGQGTLLLLALPSHLREACQLATLSALHSTHTLPYPRQPITPNLRQFLPLQNFWSGKRRVVHNQCYPGTQSMSTCDLYLPNTVVKLGKHRSWLLLAARCVTSRRRQKLDFHSSHAVLG